MELDSSPQKPVASSSRDRTLTESDRIKQAALSGNSKGAMESPEPASASTVSKDAGDTPTPSPLKGGKMTWSRKAGAAAAKLAAEDSRSASDQDRDSMAATKDNAASPVSKEEALAAHGAKLFALPPGLAASDSDQASSSGSGARQQRTFTSRRNPIDSSTLGRKSAARPMASDLFATSGNGAAAGGRAEEADAASATRADTRSEAEDSPAVLARQRIARPRTGSAAALARRSRVTTSMYDPDLNIAADPSSSSSPRSPPSQLGGVAEEASPAEPSTTLADKASSASAASQIASLTADLNSGNIGNRSDAFRRRIEALKSEVGDDWLRLLARGGGAAGDRNSALLLAAVNEENSSADKASEVESSATGEAEGRVTRVVRAKKSKKKIRNDASALPSLLLGVRRANTVIHSKMGGGGRHASRSR